MDLHQALGEAILSAKSDAIVAADKTGAIVLESWRRADIWLCERGRCRSLIGHHYPSAVTEASLGWLSPRYEKRREPLWIW